MVTSLLPKQVMQNGAHFVLLSVSRDGEFHLAVLHDYCQETTLFRTYQDGKKTGSA
jgi:hypothetical protein